MLFDDPALRQLKQQFNHNKIKQEGVVRATDRGFGFLETNDHQSFFINPVNMKRLMHGDRISAVIEEDRGRTQAVPEKLIEPALTRFVARVSQAQGRIQVIADHPNIKFPIHAEDKRPAADQSLHNGDWVICNLTRHALNRGNKFFQAEIIEWVTSANDPKAPWTVSLRGLDLPTAAPEAPAELKFNEESLSRQDLTNLPFVTIDSAKTKDMDDALYIENRPEGGWNLWVAIADPTGYIDGKSELDAQASKRAFSIYLPGRDIPMLPRVMSDDLCSLREGQNRPVLAACIPVFSDGAVDSLNSKFCLAVIKSQGKLVYNEVSDYLEQVPGAKFKPSDAVAQVLKLLVEFTHARDNYRRTHSAAFRNRPDYDFVLTEDGALDHIEVNFRRIANQIVEEAMISANIAAGDILADKLHCGIFNVHPGFDLTQKDEIVKLLTEEGFPQAQDLDLSLMDNFSAIRRYANSLDSTYLDNRIRKLQEFSQISITPAPHFALGVKNYATWTSPIRKYGDMINHRLLKSLIVGGEQPKLPNDETLNTMNQARRINRMAERDVRDWLYVDYLEPEIKKATVLDGEVFDVNRGGMRVFLTGCGAMIFVPASTMSADKDRLSLDSGLGKVFVDQECVLRLGDPIKVKIIEVNHDTRSIVGAPAQSIGGLALPDPAAARMRRRH